MSMDSIRNNLANQAAERPEYDAVRVQTNGPDSEKAYMDQFQGTRLGMASNMGGMGDSATYPHQSADGRRECFVENNSTISPRSMDYFSGASPRSAWNQDLPPGGAARSGEAQEFEKNLAASELRQNQAESPARTWKGNDSHARLFGVPDDLGARAKPNFMKSDIFGTGLGSPMTHGKLMDQFKCPSKQATEDVGRNFGYGHGLGRFGHGGGDNMQNMRHPEHVEGVIPAGASLGDAPMINARETGGNPVTGAGYQQQEGRVQRRRQYPNNQYATSKLW